MLNTDLRWTHAPHECVTKIIFTNALLNHFECLTTQNLIAGAWAYEPSWDKNERWIRQLMEMVRSSRNYHEHSSINQLKNTDTSHTHIRKQTWYCRQLLTCTYILNSHVCMREQARSFTIDIGSLSLLPATCDAYRTSQRSIALIAHHFHKLIYFHGLDFSFVHSRADRLKCPP